MVSTKLVKFFLLNTSVEVVDKLTAQLVLFQSDIKDSKKELKEVKGNSSTNGNKVTKFGPKLNAILKRIEKVKTKVA